MTSRLVVNNIDNDTGVTTIRLNPTYSSFELNSAERLRITSGGSVNIGGDYTQTSKKFKVTGNSTIDGGLLVTGLLEGGSGFSIVNGNLTLPAYTYHDGDSDTYYGFSGANEFSVVTGGSVRLKIDANGVVQVTRRLELTNSGDNHHVYEGRSWTWTSNGTSTGSIRAYMYGDSSGNLRVGTNGWNERVRITSSGNAHLTKNVGIQTSSVEGTDLVGAGTSFFGAYIGDGMLAFHNRLDNSAGYYVAAHVNALNAGPVTLGSTMTVAGTWVIV